MRIRLPIIIVLLILLTTLLVPSVTYAESPAEPESIGGFVLEEETSDYKVYKSDKTKEYIFIEKGKFLFWLERKIPDKYKPKDEGIISSIQAQGKNPDRYHIKRDYSPDYPVAITYKDADSDEMVAMVTGLPQVTSTGELIDCKWSRVGATFVSGTNIYEATVNGTRVNLTSDWGFITWKPQLFLNDVEQTPSSPIILPVDPVNSNYQQNTLEWDYGVIKRRVRLIEGKLLERWIVESNPYGEIRIKHNAIGDYPLKLSGAWDARDNPLEAIVTEDEEIIPAKAFSEVAYPVEIYATLTVNPDATHEDGHARHEVAAGITWGPMQGGVGTGGSDAGLTLPISIHSHADANEYLHIIRVITMFDTSALGTSATITNAVYSLYGKAKADALGITPTYNVYSSNPANDNAVVAGDYDSCGTTAFSTAITHAVWNVAGFNNYTLNAQGKAAISLTGTTKFSWREATYDAPDNDPVAGGAGAVFSGADAHSSETGAGKEPKLVITYTAPPTVTSSPATNVEETTATLNGNITSTGSNPVCDYRGCAWDIATHADPGNVAPPATYSANITVHQTHAGEFAVGPFTCNITGLTKGELYYFRTHSHNTDVGWDWSNTEQKFLTKPDEPTNLVVVVGGCDQLDLTWTTGTGFDTTYIVRKLGGYPANRADGVNVYNGAGVAYSDTTVVGGTHPYYRAWSYCTEGGLEQYSDLFAQDNEPALGGPTTGCNMPLDASPPSTTEMYYSANVTSLGGYASYIERGFVWGTISVPANPGNVAPPAGYASSWTETGTWVATGIYDYDATGLSEGTTYYIRSCAHNATCWKYSSEIVFDTYDEVVWYEPNTMIIATTLPDRAGGDDDGTIVWGANTGITIILGEMESSEGTSAATGEAEGFDVPTSPLPSTWFAAGENVANLPFYDNFNSVATQIGMPVHTIYFLLIIGLALSLALFVIVFTRSALLGAVVLVIVLFIGSSQTIVPMWIPFAILIVEIGIMFLYRHVSY